MDGHKGTASRRCGLSLAWLAVGLMLLAGPAAMAADQGRLLYRYIDDTGATVLDDHVPPEFVHRGYTVLGTGGRVLEEVPAALDPEDAEAGRAAAVEAERLRKWDESLLRRYSSVADIEAARQRALNEINVRIEILHSNLLSTKSQIEREQSRAADLERRSIPVPESLLRTVDTLQRELDDIEDTIVQRHRDADNVKVNYQEDIERFQILLERLELGSRQGR